MESSKNFWVNLGIFGSFGQEKPCAEEDPKRLYKPKKMVLDMDMEGILVIDSQELTELSLSLPKLFYINFGKTSY